MVFNFLKRKQENKTAQEEVAPFSKENDMSFEEIKKEYEKLYKVQQLIITYQDKKINTLERFAHDSMDKKALHLDKKMLESDLKAIGEDFLKVIAPEKKHAPSNLSDIDAFKKEMDDFIKETEKEIRKSY